MRSFLFSCALMIALLFHHSSASACTVLGFSGDVGSANVPPTDRVTGIVGNGTNILTIYTVLDPLGSPFVLGTVAGGITATGGLPRGAAFVTSVVASGNQISINGGAFVLTFSGLTFAYNSGSWNGATGALTEIRAVGPSSIQFLGYNSDTNTLSAPTFSASSSTPCQITVSESGNSNSITLSATASGASQVQFFVDGTYVGTSNGPTFLLPFDSKTLRNGAHSYYGIATFGGGTVTSATGTFLVSNSLFSSQYFHTCAVDSNGAAYCWGFNGYAAIGDGTTTDRAVPTSVFGLQASVEQIASGATHSCAVVAGGTVSCWGGNYRGQIGNGTSGSTLVPTPVPVIGLSGVATLSLGYQQTCAIKIDGTLWCWGSNISGELGNGTFNNSSVPVQVTGLTNVQVVAAGANQTCAIAAGGALFCWGSNAYGQVGDGTTSNRSAPVQIIASGVSAVGGGATHTCAVVTGGWLKCWGHNADGELGNSSTINSTTPVTVSLASVQAVVAGAYDTCAITKLSGIKCWGMNSWGGLGNGTTTTATIPVAVTGNTSGVLAVTTGYQTTCGIISGQPYCWGYNQYGTVGNNNAPNNALNPVSVVPF